ncbi:hypothetical protein AI2618V1_1909 [Serratia marcescens]|uniref:hypothetical protein n=1 Tax=Serratia marcescens TaxID=615 RepID=UPI001D4B777E|nr:hypothetical protein [Serratia marcescens]CAE7299430.1 hypothetical protein AI2618V1_1909 [Serratia marcescens]CAE7299582.1 hypothetical protein AI2617V1_1902 [Serratia marcescens]CAH3649952.1 hypothetical protein AI2618V1_1909 [Serratia marcescens]CAH3946236.1 hypothetical protein AI2617V1_1902 [Serratia marcescens]
MSGFQAYNTYGNIVVDSEQKGTVISSLIPQGNVEVTGYLIPTAFGDGRSLGYMVSDILFQPGLLWCRFTRDSYCFPGAELFEPNSVQFMRTSVNGTVQSGYLDVFNGQGNLIWSAASAGTMPRVFDHLVIPQGYNLQGQVISKNLGWSPWFLLSGLPGNVSESTESMGFSGFLLRYTNGNIQVTYAAQYQDGYPQATNQQLLRIPLAVFTGY